jgi:hypothetical protein
MMRKKVQGLKTSYSVKDVMVALQTMGDLSSSELSDLEFMLPDNWRKLIDQCGRKRVFDCLRMGMSIGGAKFELLSKQRLEAE